MLRLPVDSCNKRKIDIYDRLGRERFFRLLCGFAHPVKGDRIFRQIDFFFFAVLLHDIIRQALVKIVAAKMIVPGSRQHLDQPFSDLDQGYVERAAAKVIHHDFLRSPVIQSVGECRRGRFVDDPQYIQSGNPSGILRRLPLCIIKISRDGDDRLAHSFAKIALRILFQLHQDVSGYFLRRIALAVNLLAVRGSHFPLD